MAKKKQGYNSRMDESLSMRNKGKKKQSMKSRRDESKGMEKAMGKRAYSSVGTMDKSGKKKVRKKAQKKGVSGDNYVAAVEKYDRKQNMKELKNMKTPGIATAMKKAQRSRTSLPKLRPQRKGK